MTVLTSDLTFQLGATGMLLNGDAVSPFVDVYSAKGFDSAPFRMTQREREGDDGGYMDAIWERGRDIVLTGQVIATVSTIEPYLDDLKENWAPSSVLIPLYFRAPGVNERFLYVKPLGCKYDWDAARRTGCCDIQLSAFAEDPRIYDNVGFQSLTIPLGATVYTGFGFSLGFPFGFGGVSLTTDTVIVNVEGNRPTPPLFTITGPVTNPRILNDTLGKEMIFNTTLAGGEQLIIDSKYKTVRLNGTANRRSTLIAPTWFYLPPGASTIRYRAESSDPTSTLNIQYYPAWR